MRRDKATRDGASCVGSSPASARRTSARGAGRNNLQCGRAVGVLASIDDLTLRRLPEQRALLPIGARSATHATATSAFVHPARGSIARCPTRREAGRRRLSPSRPSASRVFLEGLTGLPHQRDSWPLGNARWVPVWRKPPRRSRRWGDQPKALADKKRVLRRGTLPSGRPSFKLQLGACLNWGWPSSAAPAAPQFAGRSPARASPF
jgi:hypothetical protein